MNINFNVLVVLNSVELLTNVFEIKEETKVNFLGTEHYINVIRSAMKGLGVLENYIDMFDCADPEVIFDKYVSVDEKGVKFDFENAATGNDREMCYFKVPCTFDAQKYLIKMAEMNENDSSERPSDSINGWELTDDSCFQYARKLYDDCGLETWAMVQLEGTEEVGYRVRACANLCLSDYSREYIDSVVSSYYDGGIKQVERDYPDNSQQIILECIFEQEQGDNCHFIQEVTNEGEGYETIKRWLANNGVVGTAVNTLIHRHNRALEESKVLEFDEQKLKELGLDGDTVAISVYRETVSPDLAGDGGVGTLKVPKALFIKYFKECILPNFRGDDKNVSDEGLMQKWLDEYTPDDTTNLYDWLESHKDKEYYIDLYNRAYDTLLDESKKDGSVDPQATANDLFDECATAEEVVGSYLEYHGNDAFQDWMENLTFYLERSKEKQEEFSPIKQKQDAIITKILSKLCNQFWIKDIVWDIPEGKSPSNRLSENKAVPLPSEEDLKTMGHVELESRIIDYLFDNYGFYPKEFSYISPIDNLPMKCEVTTTNMLGIRRVEWFVPKGMKAPEADGPNGTYCVELPSMDKFNTDDIYTERVRIELIQKYGFVPKYFQYIRPDGRAANSRHLDLSSSMMSQSKLNEIATDILAKIYLEQYGEHDAYDHWLIDKNFHENTHMFSEEVRGILMHHYYDATTHDGKEGVGCYGSGTEACLNFCTGCDSRKNEKNPLTESEIRCFWDDKAMYIEWSNGSDSMCQDNDYKLMEILEAVKEGRGKVYFDGYIPSEDPEYEVKLMQFEEQMEYEKERNRRFDVSKELPLGPVTNEEIKDYLIQDYCSIPRIYIYHGTESQVKQKFITDCNDKVKSGYTISSQHNVIAIRCKDSEKAVYVATPIDSLKKFNL